MPFRADASRSSSFRALYRHMSAALPCAAPLPAPSLANRSAPSREVSPSAQLASLALTASSRAPRFATSQPLCNFGFAHPCSKVISLSLVFRVHCSQAQGWRAHLDPASWAFAKSRRTSRVSKAPAAFAVAGPPRNERAMSSTLRFEAWELGSLGAGDLGLGWPETPITPHSHPQLGKAGWKTPVVGVSGPENHRQRAFRIHFFREIADNGLVSSRIT